MRIRRVIYGVICFVLVCSLFTVTFADDSGDSDDVVTSQETVEVTQLRVSPSDTSGLHAIILSLLGDYNPISTDYTYTTTSYNGTTQTNHVVEIAPDWSWIMTCALFIIVIYSVFRLIGGIFSNR